MAARMTSIVPHLWFDTQAIEAAQWYVSIFPDSTIHDLTTIEAPRTPTGTCDIVSFELSGNMFMAINAGPLFRFSEAISFMVYCDTQEEIDYYWEKLSSGGEEQACGWLKDKYGLSWQIVPAEMQVMMRTKDKDQLARVTSEVLSMVKLDIERIQRAYSG